MKTACKPSHNNGDGASASSVGTSSPDIFQSNNGPSGASNGEFKGSALSDNDVIVTLEDVPSGEAYLIVYFAFSLTLTHSNFGTFRKYHSICEKQPL